jgi:hypothetical protein
MEADQDLSKALARMQSAGVSQPTVDDAEAPVTRLMFDGGTFDHMFGTDITEGGMITNLRKVKPVPCRIAN